MYTKNNSEYYEEDRHPSIEPNVLFFFLTISPRRHKVLYLI